MMNYFSALHKYDLEIRFHRRDLYQTSAFCGHVFTMKLLLKKLTLGHMTENKCGYQMHIFVTSFSAQHAPAWRCFCMVQPLRQPFRPKCTNRILQMHQQNPVVPPESGVHPQNPVCTYSVNMRRIHNLIDDKSSLVQVMFDDPREHAVISTTENQLIWRHGGMVSESHAETWVLALYFFRRSEYSDVNLE